SWGYAERAGGVCAVVLDGGDGDAADDGAAVVVRVPVPAGARRGGELAGGDEGGERVVPAAGARAGGGAVRQRVGGGRGDRAADGAGAVPRVRKLAAGVRGPGAAGVC